MAKNHTAFDNIEFPPYEFREFPMAVPVNAAGEVQPTPYNDRGKSHPVVIVNSQRELDALKGPEVTTVVVEDTGARRLQSEDDIRKVLYQQAEVRGVKIDKKWPVERIEKALQDAAEKPQADASEVV